MSNPRARDAWRIALAQRMARAGPSKIARKSSPRIHFPASVTFQLAAHNIAMTFKEVAPGPVPKFSGVTGRVHDVGE